MKILLMNTTPIRQAFKALHLQGAYNGSGWVEEILPYLCEHNEVVFACFWTVQEMRKAKEGKIEYYVIPAAHPDLWGTDQRMRNAIRKLYDELKPDIIQIFGTEHEWAWDVLQIMDASRIVIHLAGFAGILANHYYGGLIKTYNTTLRDWLKGGMRTNRKKFEKHGETEKEILKAAVYVMGRTVFDKACVTQINPGLNYYYCNEMLRGEFYNKNWSLGGCIRHRIFVSAGNYPIKGIHQAIKAVGIIKRFYRDVELVMAGNNIVSTSSWKDRLKMTSYGRYIIQIMREEGVEDNVRFIGAQDSEGMVQQYLRAHVYVLPSVIENSSNSLGEAMLLGMPCVASYVGGTPDMIKEGEEGFLYPYDEPYMLAYYVMKFFEDDELAVRLGAAANARALETHDKNQIGRTLLKIYQEIDEKAGEHK